MDPGEGRGEFSSSDTLTCSARHWQDCCDTPNVIIWTGQAADPESGRTQDDVDGHGKLGKANGRSARSIVVLGLSFIWATSLRLLAYTARIADQL